MKKSIYIYLVYFSLLFLWSCKNVYYTLSGSTATGNLQILPFSSVVAGGPANLAQKFTEDLKTYYIQNSRLRISNDKADYLVEGEIIDYQVAPLSPTAQDQASQTRITITVAIRFTDNKDSNNNFEQNFSQYADFPQSSTLNQVESSKVQEILDKLIFDIFQKTVANW
ncbi:MAG: LptE family protein [Thermonemataceae bacterium]|nr:LptE family protein [Thermonemataceae bacterium]